MKYSLPLLAAAMACLIPFGAGAAERISTSSYSVFSSSDAMSRASLLYTDGAGRLTEFSSETEEQVVTVTIRQDGAVVWQRSFPEGNGRFSVSRREEGGAVTFLMDIGGRLYEAAPSAKGDWEVRPAGSRPQAVPLS